MKDQYFGDGRDYFKYDVLDRLASELNGIRVLTCLWMLTPGDLTGQGRSPFVPDPELASLTAFFQERLEPRDDEQCRVSEMSKFFDTRPFGFVSYRDGSDTFGPTTRSEYFRSVPAEALKGAVVFFDPDVGMEPPSGGDSKHLRFGELGEVFRRMDRVSVAVVFQHQRRVKDWVESIGREIAETVSPHVGWIKEPMVAFYIVAKSAERLDEALPILHGIEARRTPGVKMRRQVGVLA